MPSRRAVRIDDSYWIVGNANLDSFNGRPVRKSYGLKKATGLMTRLTPGHAALGNPGYDFYAQKDFFKDTTNALTQSDLGVMWNVFCPFDEALARGQFLRQDGRLFRIRNLYPTVDEYMIAEADELEPDALQIATFTLNGKLDIATDTYPTTTVVTQVIQTDPDKFYRYRDDTELTRQAGDIAVFAAQSALTVTTGAEFTMLGRAWRATLVQPEYDSWAILARPT